MSSSTSSRSASPSPMPARVPSIAQLLPQDVLARIARSLTVDTGANPQDTLQARQEHAHSFVRVCRAWRATGTKAFWREIEVKLMHADRLRAHLEVHKSLYAHVESIMINLGTYNWGMWSNETRNTVPAILSNCYQLDRLEIVGGQAVVPGPLFQALQSKVNLAKLASVVVTWGRGPHSWTFRTDPGCFSPLFLFPFLRDCQRLRNFAFDGWSDLISNPAPGPPARRIKLDSLRLDIRNAADNASIKQAPEIRIRFLTNFQLGHLIEFSGHVLFTDGEWWAAFDQMRNLEYLTLRPDFDLETGGIDELSSRLARLARLRVFKLVTDEDPNPKDEHHPSRADMQRLLDAVPASVTTCEVWLAVPEPAALEFIGKRFNTKLKRFSTFTYDPLELAPVAIHERFVKPGELTEDEG